MTDRKQQQKRGTSGPKPASPEHGLGTYAERYAAGKALREACPRSEHAIWKAPPAAGRSRTDSEGREGRCPTCSPSATAAWFAPRSRFSAGGPHDGLRPRIDAVLRGPRPVLRDAHLCNFGGFATPERRVIFAINDLDETLPAPWSGTSSASRQASWWPAAITA